MRELIPWIQPLGLLWLALLAGAGISAVKRRWATASALFLPWVLLTLISCMPVPSALLVSLEKRFPPAQAGDIAACDVLVCLGGGIEPAPHEPHGLHLKRGSDRVATSLTLAVRHQIPDLVLGGGAYGGDPEWHSEADEVARLLSEMKVPGLTVHSLGSCAHTRDEALKFKELLKQHPWKRIGLVTSAGHMPRAAATFEKAGVKVLAIPCNYLSSHMRLGKLHWFHPPAAEGFLLFNDWLHEILGMAHYRRNAWM